MPWLLEPLPPRFSFRKDEWSLQLYIWDHHWWLLYGVSFLEGRIYFGSWLGNVTSIMVGEEDTVEFAEAESCGRHSSDLSRPGSRERVICRTFPPFWSVWHWRNGGTQVQVTYSLLSEISPETFSKTYPDVSSVITNSVMLTVTIKHDSVHLWEALM